MAGAHSQRTLPFANRRMGKQGAFIAERHFLSVWVYSLLRVYRAPTAMHRRLPNLSCVMHGPGEEVAWGWDGASGLAVSWSLDASC